MAALQPTKPQPKGRITLNPKFQSLSFLPPVCHELFQNIYLNIRNRSSPMISTSTLHRNVCFKSCSIRFMQGNLKIYYIEDASRGRLHNLVHNWRASAAGAFTTKATTQKCTRDYFTLSYGEALDSQLSDT